LGEPFNAPFLDHQNAIRKQARDRTLLQEASENMASPTFSGIATVLVEECSLNEIKQIAPSVMKGEWKISVRIATALFLLICFLGCK
jgi:hypothetical protein